MKLDELAKEGKRNIINIKINLIIYYYFNDFCKLGRAILCIFHLKFYHLLVSCKEQKESYKK